MTNSAAPIREKAGLYQSDQHMPRSPVSGRSVGRSEPDNVSHLVHSVAG